MHALSIGTWFIHILTLFEWTIAILLIQKISTSSKKYKNLIYLSYAMLPNLASAMAAITWHIFDNDPYLYGLVYIQALLTIIGNVCLAYATWKIFSEQKKIAQNT